MVIDPPCFLNEDPITTPRGVRGPPSGGGRGVTEVRGPPQGERGGVTEVGGPPQGEEAGCVTEVGGPPQGIHLFEDCIVIEEDRSKNSAIGNGYERQDPSNRNFSQWHAN